MVSKIRQITIAIKALRHLGGRALLNYAGYQIDLRCGHLARQTRRADDTIRQMDWSLRGDLFPLPDGGELEACFAKAELERLRSAAEDVVQGKYPRFGSQAVPYSLSSAGEAYWTEYELGHHAPHAHGTLPEDVKIVWEDGRLGWVYPLLRAYRVFRDERYAGIFVENAGRFLETNPPGYGYHWTSAQEVALRLIGLVFAYQVMQPSPHLTKEFGSRLGLAIARHAARIPPSLAYARAQNNNHLLSEAAGLYTAGLALQDCPATRGWRETGWRLFNRAVLEQIDAHGAYVQQSVNYQRLALQLALWMRLLGRREGRAFPAETRERLAACTRWLADLLDEESGGLPNLGPNDGAYILPLTNRPQGDFRPFLHAAAAAFLPERPIETPDGGEMALWLCPGREPSRRPVGESRPSEAFSPCTLHIASQRSWAYLRAARFKARPGHADQCHLDLWWRGLNLAQDAGTYSYNAAPPWNNPLVQAAVHNTITLNERDQMTPAGRFLYLDWAQGRITSIQRAAGMQKAVAEHDGYRSFGALHRRSVSTAEEAPHWTILDEIIPLHGKPAVKSARLHWLLPDWPWEGIDFRERDGKAAFRLQSPHGWIVIRLEWPCGQAAALTLTCAGERLYGDGAAFPYEGWVSPTYAEKRPALSLALKCAGELPLTFTTTWQFPSSENRLKIR